MSKNRLHLLLSLLALIVMGLASGCRHHGGLNEHYKKMRPNMIKGDWATATAQMEQGREKVYKEDDQVMYWLNLGTVAHYAGDRKKSMDQLVKAEAKIQELWTTSISSEATKFIANETSQPYGGEDFEKILLYFYTALNNIEAGKMQDALVEARRADEFLKKMLVEFEKEEGGGSLYKQDAFILWLVGLLYEIEGGMNDAFLAYRAAYESYKTEYAGKFGSPVPTYLAEDMVRTAQLTGLADEAAKYKQELGATGETIDKLAQGQAEVILFHGSGEAPFKKEIFIDGQMPDGYVMRIALPEFVGRNPQIAFAELEANATKAKTQVAEPVQSIALTNYKHRLPAIKARAIARAIIKYAATQAAKAAAGGGNSTAGALVGLVGNVAAAASEAADLRSWTMLPANFGVARLWLPPGQHQVKVTYHSASGGKIGRTDTIPVDLKPGQRRIVSTRTLQ